MSAEWGSPGWQEEYNKFGEEFLKSLEFGKNVLLEAEFVKYLPLFKKAELEALSPEARSHLAAEYNYKFSPYDPITVLSDELDPENGVVFHGFRYSENDIRVGDGKKHKVVAVYPARFRRLNSINALGKESVEIIGLMGAAAMSQNAAMDPRIGEAYRKVEDAFHRVNPDTVTPEDIRNHKIAEKLMGKETTEEQPTAPKVDEDRKSVV